MAGFYQTFTATRTTEPDQPSLFAQLRTLDATAGITEHPPGTSTWKLKKNSAWTAPQIAAAQNAIDTAPETTPQLRYQRTSREKDVLTTLAVMVRDRDVAAWTAMTLAQKKAATLAEADVWATIRDFVETNL